MEPGGLDRDLETWIGALRWGREGEIEREEKEKKKEEKISHMYESKKKKERKFSNMSNHRISAPSELLPKRSKEKMRSWCQKVDKGCNVRISTTSKLSPTG